MRIVQTQMAVSVVCNKVYDDHVSCNGQTTTMPCTPHASTETMNVLHPGQSTVHTVHTLCTNTPLLPESPHLSC